MTDSPSISTLAIDGHVHIYDQYDWADAVRSLVGNLTLAAPQQKVIPIGLLTESKAHRFFNSVVESGAPMIVKGPVQVEPGPDADSLVIREAGIIKGYLIAGRQLVTAEKLEILALGRNVTIPDGLPLHDALKQVSAAGAIPALSWSPGKWFFGRGKMVNSAITTSVPGSFLIGDIGLRPALWPIPGLMKRARQLGFKIMDGSDALPLPGEERWIGRTGFQVTGAFNPATPAASVRALLADPASAFTPIGQHSSLYAFISRWGRNQLK